MIKHIALILPFLLIPAVANAQSTITLDDFNLDTTSKSENLTSGSPASNDMESCLLEQENCKNTEFKSAKSFSIDDVVNLGIIDREDVKATPAATGSGAYKASQTLPSIDIEILFDYDSDDLRPDQYPKLVELSNILKNEKFSSYRYAFLGHSDAKGSFEYNRELSENRARSVSNFIASASGMSINRMVSKGMGPSELKTPYDPFGPQNRRVQLILIPVN